SNCSPAAGSTGLLPVLSSSSNRRGRFRLRPAGTVTGDRSPEGGISSRLSVGRVMLHRLLRHALLDLSCQGPGRGHGPGAKEGQVAQHETGHQGGSTFLTGAVTLLRHVRDILSSWPARTGPYGTLLQVASHVPRAGTSVCRFFSSSAESRPPPSRRPADGKTLAPG